MHEDSKRTKKRLKSSLCNTPLWNPLAKHIDSVANEALPAGRPRGEYAKEPLKSMKSPFVLLVILVTISLVRAQEKPGSTSDLVWIGKYIVEDVAMCVQCHTPRDNTGQLIRGEYLNGAPVAVSAPPYPGMKWALKAPAIAGLLGYTKEEGVCLLTRGITRDGRVPNPPMPPFRLSIPDAEAVVAYLKSLE
jgi:mono/diheme cytochrome c family protein